MDGRVVAARLHRHPDRPPPREPALSGARPPGAHSIAAPGHRGFSAIRGADALTLGAVRWFVWAATALTACGRLGYEPLPAGEADAMPGADVVRLDARPDPDALPEPDARPPEPDAPPGPFRAAVAIEELAAPDADD